MSERLAKQGRTPSIAIADWLKSFQPGQDTPFEAAMSLMDYLQDEGLYVMRPDHAIEAATDAITRHSGEPQAAGRLEELQKLLRQHHKWHLDAGAIGLQDGDGGWIEIDNAAEYSDSLLHDQTAAALEGLSPEDAGPMPRGGISAWWWQVAVLERRKRRAAERALALSLSRPMSGGEK